MNGWRLPAGDLACAEVVDHVLERLELTHVSGSAAGVLSHGQQRRLEVGMALAARPAPCSSTSRPPAWAWTIWAQ
jgi:branched-chain amino acid transport system ATP-binding protein